MIEIRPIEKAEAEVTIPGSKSVTHRIFIASALSGGTCTVTNALKSEDTLLTLNALQQLGTEADDEGERIIIRGNSGKLKGCEEIYLANSGTSMRLLTSVAALAEGRTVLTGTERMKERPIGDLIDALRQLKISARTIHENGCPPVEILGGNVAGGNVDIRCGISSQYLSGLLLTAPLSEKGMDIRVVQGPVSRPYIDMTIDVMADFGVSVEREGYERFRIPGGRTYRPGNYPVESDASNASYFWAAAAVTGGRVKTLGILPDSRQGDVRLTRCLEQMGCRVARETDGITVTGGELKGISVDMSDMPDMVPTLAVAAAFAEGVTEIRNVAHLKAKECDRLAAVAAELTKMGGDATPTESGLIIRGGRPLHGAEIETYSDHRIAMCFAVAGLKVPGVRILDEMCVEKSFPDFWKVFSEIQNR